MYLKGKAVKLRNYMCGILSSHDNVNRVEFGNTIWKSVILPSISHGCAVWLNNTMEGLSTLKSIQYSFAKAILSIKSCPAMSATLGELGWLPIDLILNRHRVKYFHRMKYNLMETRLCKQVFMKLNNDYLDGNYLATWPYCSELHNVLCKVGLDGAFVCNEMSWLEPYMKLSIDNYSCSFFQDIDKKSSLYWYRSMKKSSFGEKYLLNMNDFYASQLKFKARTGCLGIGENPTRWGVSDPTCNLCKGSNEDLVHFLFLCPAFSNIRNSCFRELEAELEYMGAQEVWFHFSGSSVLGKLGLFLGTDGFLYNENVGSLFDRICKSFLLKAWGIRRESNADLPDPT